MIFRSERTIRADAFGKSSVWLKAMGGSGRALLPGRFVAAFHLDTYGEVTEPGLADPGLLKTPGIVVIYA